VIWAVFIAALGGQSTCAGGCSASPQRYCSRQISRYTLTCYQASTSLLATEAGGRRQVPSGSLGATASCPKRANVRDGCIRNSWLFQTGAAWGETATHCAAPPRRGMRTTRFGKNAICRRPHELSSTPSCRATVRVRIAGIVPGVVFSEELCTGCISAQGRLCPPCAASRRPQTALRA
jgi:hypothetical protein